MARYGKVSKLSPAQVLEMALQFFGPAGLGLKVVELGEGCMSFEGGGGHVFVQVYEDGKGSQVELETREWDAKVREFIAKI